MKDFQIYKETGLFASAIKKDLKTYLESKNEFTDLEIVTYVESKIKEKYELAFPVLIGYNNIITHSTANFLPQKIIPKKEILRIDFGINNKGYIIDTAYTYNLENNSQINELIQYYNLFFKKIENFKAGDKYNQIGLLVENEILSKGNYYLLDFLCGHGVIKNKLHATPEYIYNYYVENFNDELKEGDVFCVEPFISLNNLKIFFEEGNVFKIKDKITCERFADIKENSEIYQLIKSKTKAKVVHIEHQYYVFKNFCYKLT